MPHITVSDPELPARLAAADVIFVAQDGFRLAPARVRAYSFARLLARKGLRAEVLSFFDHLGAADQGGPVLGVPTDDKVRLNVAAYDLLARNPRAVLYVQKAGYHALACVMASARNGNPLILDYDDHDLESHAFRDVEPWLPCLAPDRLLAAVAGRANACVVSSRRIFDLVAPHNANTHLIHTVADQEVFSAAGRERPRRRFGDAVNILWCGDVWGHIPMKDLFLAVDAFTLVPARVRARARFHIIGFGTAWALTRERMGRRYAGLDGLVLHDFVPPAEMPDVLREMDIGVLPYHENAFNLAKSPTKMFEYMLAKVAVLATPVGEVVHCLEDGRSVVLASGLEAFAGGLERLIDDAPYRRGIADAAHGRALAEYSLQGVGDRLAAIVRAAREAPAGTGPGLEPFLADALGRRRRMAPREVELARQDLHALAAATDLDAANPRRWSALLLAMLDWPDLGRQEGIGADRLAELRAAGARLRPSVRLRPRLGAWTAAGRPPGPPRLCKLAAAEDWEDPAWFSWLDAVKTDCLRFRPSDAAAAIPIAGSDLDRLEEDDRLDQGYSYFKRNRGDWERAQILYGLDRLGLLDGTARLLVAGTDIDGLYLMLTEHAAMVDVIDLGARAAAHAARVAAGETDPWLLTPRLYHRDRLAIHHGPFGPAVFADRCWDAVVVVQDTLARIDAAAFLDWADGRLRPDGVLAFSAEVRLDGDGPPERPPLPGDGRGFVALDEFDATLGDTTLDRTVRAGTADADHPHFVTDTGAGLFAPAVWICRRGPRA